MGSTLALVRTAYGTWLVLAPASVLARAAGTQLDGASVAVARVLGVRHLAQAALLRTHPGGRWLLVGAGIDAVHALSMAALARCTRTTVHSRPAARDARTAALLAAAEAIAGAWARRR